MLHTALEFLKGSCGFWILSTICRSWIWQIVLLWDPLDLGSCIRAMLWDPRDLGSCRAVLPSDPVDLGSYFLVTARVWRPCGWDKASINSKLTFHQSHFASCCTYCLGKMYRKLWTRVGKFKPPSGLNRFKPWFNPRPTGGGGAISSPPLWFSCDIF